jgi:phosphatidylinositol phospholipase C delta
MPVDCLNGEGEPVANHRKTLTTSAPVRDICKAIDKYAFVTSPYPVIISAEVHCSFEQQGVLGTILREVFGEKLITAPINPSTSLPSPKELRGRILFKAKPPVVDTPAPLRELSVYESTTSSTESDTGFARLARKLSINASEKPAFSPSLTDLLIYTTGVKYQGFSKLVEYQAKHQFSVSERTGARILRDNKADWVKHNFGHISRVYPKATRMDSTNFDPLPLWQAGCQVVALNWQTHGMCRVV